MINREEFEDLIAAYALDACDPDEAAAIDEFLLAHPEVVAEVEQLRGAAAWLGASEALTPPSDVRGALLDRARAARPGEAASPLDAYGREVDRLAVALAGVEPADAERITHNGLTIRELVLHLLAAERKLAEELVQPQLAQWDDAVMRTITETELAEHRELAFHAAVGEWRAAADAVRRLAPNVEHAVAGRRPADVLVIRAFETWTHHDDIRRALGRDGSPPAREVLRAMAEFSMRSVPWVLAATNRQRPGQWARLRLTGLVESEWTVALAPGVPLVPGQRDLGAPVATLTVDVIDWCRRFADRMPAEQLVRQVEGDQGVADDLVLAAPAFAGL